MIPTDTLNKRHSIGSTVAMDVFEAAVNTGDVQQMKEAFKAIPSGQRHLVSNTNAAKVSSLPRLHPIVTRAHKEYFHRESLQQIN